MRKIKFLILLVCIIPAMLVASVVSAQEPFPGEELWTNTEVVIDPALGIEEAGLVPGTDGYKVFNPGAIKILTTNGGVGVFLTRRSYTDAWGFWPGPLQNWKLTGSHTSESSLVENKIWADGFLKYQGQGGWQTKCSHRLRGRRAHCNTTFSGQLARIYAETFHHFELKGATTKDFTTRDTW